MKKLFLKAKVANDDVTSFRNNNSWLVYHPGEALMFRELDNVWEELKPVYSGYFKKLVFADFPNEADIYMTLKQIKQRLLSVTWTIKVD